ncbi:hypothetical protein [Sorangium sp. So ce861]|uniref:hypothetical protein n=1 Tax=Sorangium sp. So ce861 TaxID=3133323 RepID=UPI003F60997B
MRVGSGKRIKGALGSGAFAASAALTSATLAAGAATLAAGAATLAAGAATLATLAAGAATLAALAAGAATLATLAAGAARAGRRRAGRRAGRPGGGIRLVIAASGANHHGRAKQQRACKDAHRSFHVSFSPLGCSPPKNRAEQPHADHRFTPPRRLNSRRKSRECALASRASALTCNGSVSAPW